MRFVGEGHDFVFAEEVNFVFADYRAASYRVYSYFVLLALSVAPVSAEGEVRAFFFFLDGVCKSQRGA